MKLFGCILASFVSSSGRISPIVENSLQSDNNNIRVEKGRRPLTTALLPPQIDQDVVTISDTSSGLSVVVDQVVSDLKISGGTTSNPVDDGIRSWLSTTVSVSMAEAAPPPSKEEIKLLREAFAAFYGMDRNLETAEQLLSQTIDAWQRQPPDEKAGLYRVRGDCYLALLRPSDAVKDYTSAITLIEGPGGDEADPEELPLAYLGRARAARSQSNKLSKEELVQAANDYQKAIRLSSREEWDTDLELEEDGASRNPYAAWEWGSTLRQAGNLQEAYRVHILASDTFDDIGDRIHSIISELDAGIDLAAMPGKVSETKTTIEGAIKRMKTIDGGEVSLLQSLLAKEGESRVAVASVLWDAGEKQDAETKYGNACLRLDQLADDAQKRVSTSSNTKDGTLESSSQKLRFSIDDGPGPFDISCSRFKNKAFLTETLQWPESLQKKVLKLEQLK